HAAGARLEPLDAALDKEKLRRDAALGGAGVAEAAFTVRLPGVGQLVLLQDVFVGDRDVGAERRIGGDDIHRPQWDLLLGGGQIGQMPQRELQGVDVVNVPTAVTRQHHVHLSGADQEWVKVGPEHVGGGIFF